MEIQTICPRDYPPKVRIYDWCNWCRVSQPLTRLLWIRIRITSGHDVTWDPMRYLQSICVEKRWHWITIYQVNLTWILWSFSFLVLMGNIYTFTSIQNFSFFAGYLRLAMYRFWDILGIFESWRPLSNWLKNFNGAGLLVARHTAYMITNVTTYEARNAQVARWVSLEVSTGTQSKIDFPLLEQVYPYT
jgi:hypothetical protein